MGRAMSDPWGTPPRRPKGGPAEPGEPDSPAGRVHPVRPPGQPPPGHRPRRAAVRRPARPRSARQGHGYGQPGTGSARLRAAEPARLGHRPASPATGSPASRRRTAPASRTVRPAAATASRGRRLRRPSGRRGRRPRAGLRRPTSAPRRRPAGWHRPQSSDRPGAVRPCWSLGDRPVVLVAGAGDGRRLVDRRPARLADGGPCGRCSARRTVADPLESPLRRRRAAGMPPRRAPRRPCQPRHCRPGRSRASRDAAQRLPTLRRRRPRR